MDNTYIYKDKPIFGLDIGFSSIKVLQLHTEKTKAIIDGYGACNFDASAVSDGVILDPEALAKTVQKLFKENIVGHITTRRICIAVPAARTFTRSMTLPRVAESDFAEAVRLEAEQYIPVPLDQLYIDYDVIRHTEKETELLAVAVPKKIVDSYTVFARLLGLEVVALEPSIGAAARLYVQAERSDVPAVLIDFGSMSSDITIYDRTLIVTGTVLGGGDSFTNLIAEKLQVTRPEAHIIKTKYGLGVSKKQKEITDALTPILEQLVKEIRRMIRYYEERSKGKGKIGQIVTMGGGANMPGLSEYLTNRLRLPSRMCDPWQNMSFGKLQPPNNIEKSMYITVAGLALTRPQEAFHD